MLWLVFLHFEFWRKPFYVSYNVNKHINNFPNKLCILQCKFWSLFISMGPSRSNTWEKWNIMLLLWIIIHIIHGFTWWWKNEVLAKFKKFKSEVETCGQHIFMLKLDNGGKYPNKLSLNFFRNMAFEINSQHPIWFNTMVLQRDIIDHSWILHIVDY